MKAVFKVINRFRAKIFMKNISLTNYEAFIPVARLFYAYVCINSTRSRGNASSHFLPIISKKSLKGIFSQFCEDIEPIHSDIFCFFFCIQKWFLIIDRDKIVLLNHNRTLPSLMFYAKPMNFSNYSLEIVKSYSFSSICIKYNSQFFSNTAD